MTKIIKETAKDPTLLQLKECILQGYIPATKKLPLKPYKNIFKELTISDEGLILKQHQIILPQSLWKKAFEKAHQGSHPGVSSMKRRLRSHFWFPNLNQTIEEGVKKCQDCQMFTIKYTKEPITSLPTPKHPWKEVSIDLFGPMPNNKHVLVVQDMLSRFPAAKIVPSTAAKPVIGALDQIYTDFGTPETHRSDNGPPFNSTAFADYSNAKAINHQRIYPYHPQANPVETFMKPLGKALKITHHHRQDPNNALNTLLTNYRSTPHSATGETPASMLFRHQYHHDLPLIATNTDTSITNTV